MSSPILLDFHDQPSAAKALKKVAQYMQRAGQPVVSTNFDPKIKRTSGVSFREALLTLASGQVVTLRVTQSGDVFQVLLNGSLKPIKNANDQIKAIGEIAAMAEANQSAFQKKQARVKVELPKSIKTAAPRMEVALQSRAEELDAQIAERKKQVSDLKAELGEGVLDSATIEEVKSKDMSWCGFKVVNQEFVDKSTPIELPSSNAISGSIYVSLERADGTYASIPGIVVAVKFSASNVIYSVAIPISHEQGSGSQLYAVIHDIDAAAVNVRNPDAALDAVMDFSDAVFDFANLRKQDSRNVGHGHVFQRPDGMRARCGGEEFCSTCQRDAAAKDAGGTTSLALDSVGVSLSDDALEQLGEFPCGGKAIDDSKVLSVSGRDELVAAGLVARDDGANWLTEAGQKFLAEMQKKVLDSVEQTTGTEEGQAVDIATALDLAKSIMAGTTLDSAGTALAVETLRSALDAVELSSVVNMGAGNLDQANRDDEQAESLRAALVVLDAVAQDARKPEASE